MKLYDEPELNKAITLVSGNPLVVLLKRWSELEPNRVRKYDYLWLIQCRQDTCETFFSPESIQDRATIQYAVQLAATELNLSCELQSKLDDNWHAAFYLINSNYCLPLGAATHTDSSVAMLAAYVDALEVINAELVA